MVDLVQKEMTLVWAETGDIIQPDATKISNGWDVELVPRQWWNWMQNRVDHNIAYLLQKGFPEWSAAVEYIINKSYVQHLGVVYKCIQTHTNQTPAVGAYWVKAFVESSNSLEAIQPLTVAANQIAYYTGANTAATTPLTSFARTLLDDASASAARTTLGAQAADATLTALAGVATGLNKLPYFTGTDAADVTDLSAYGRTLIATADAAAARTALGLQSGATTSVGTIATQNANNVAITGGSIAGITDLAIADGGTGASNASDARSNLGLGTAATGDVTTSTIDSTIGRILRVGDFGFGSTTLPITNDFNAITGSGWYANTSGAAVGLPLADRIFTVMHVALNANTAMQYAIDTFTSTTDQRVFVRTKNTGTWAAWNEVWTSENQLNIGTTASSARTALGLANSSTIAAATAATPSTLVQRDANGVVFADGIVSGDATYLAQTDINTQRSYTADQSVYNIRNNTYVTDATLTADRAAVGTYGLVENQGQYAEAFSVNTAAFQGIARSGSATGGWSVTGEGTYQGGTFTAQYQSSNATNKYCQNLYGVVALAQLNSSVGVVSQAAAINATLANSVAGGTITNGYGLLLNYSATGTITNKWSIYSQSSAFVGYHAGKIRFGGSATQSPRGTVDVVGDLAYDAIVLGATAVDVDTITGNGVVTNVTSSTTGTFQVFQPKDGVIVTYTDGTDRTQIHYASNTVWTRIKVGAAAYTPWQTFVKGDNAGLIAGSCSFSGNGAITVLRNTANLSISRVSAGVYAISGVFGLASNLPVVAMTNAGGRVNLTQAANGSNLQLTVYGYNNATPTDTTYLNVILGN